MKTWADGPAAGTVNMAADVAMLEAGSHSFRTYSWWPHCLSLGRFEPEDDIDRQAAETLGIDVVRRPTGGGAILHGLDVTFCLVQPAWPGARLIDLYTAGSDALAAGLALLGIDAVCARRVGPVTRTAACFASAQGPDLRVGERKICGSAMRVERDACLMHGSIFLDADWERTATLVRGAPADALEASAVTVGELRRGTTRTEVEEALAEGVRTCLSGSHQPGPIRCNLN